MNDDVILMAHGSGGQLSHDLVARVFVRHLNNPTLAQLDDAAVVGGSDPGAGTSSRLAISTDSYVVSPLFFPGVSGGYPLSFYLLRYFKFLTIYF